LIPKGTMSSGGTESIMLACKAYRDLARSRGIRRPEMIVPESAHAAFNKASQYFNIKLNMIKIDEKTKKVNLKLMRNAINSHTCMLVGSAPNFSYGVMDPIPEISELGVKYNIPVHVNIDRNYIIRSL
jgi:sphinganine-1-phosphate aldolase